MQRSAVLRDAEVRVAFRISRVRLDAALQQIPDARDIADACEFRQESTAARYELPLQTRLAVE